MNKVGLGLIVFLLLTIFALLVIAAEPEGSVKTQTLELATKRMQHNE
jgi:hypothetical protein